MIREASPPPPRKKTLFGIAQLGGGTSPPKLILTLLIFGAKRKMKKLPKMPQGARNNNKYFLARFGQDFNFRFSRDADVWLRF